MNVYVVMYLEPPLPETIVAICSTIEIAIEYLNARPETYYIKEWELEQ